MTDQLSHLWITAPYQEDRTVALAALVGKQTTWRSVDCHQRHSGPLSGTRSLVRQLVYELAPHAISHIMNYARAILSVAPELRPLLPDTKQTLTEAADFKERFRFYGEAHSERLAHSLVSFILQCPFHTDLPPVYLVFEHVHAADPLDQKVLAALVRRARPERITVVVCTAEDGVSPLLQPALARYTRHVCPDPLPEEACLQIASEYQLPEEWTTALLQYGAAWRGQWKAFEGRKDLLTTLGPQGATFDECTRLLVARCPIEVQHALARSYIQSNCTSDDVLARSAYELAAAEVTQRFHDEQARALESAEREFWALGAIPYHYEHGQSPAVCGVEALLYATHTCLQRGFYEAVIDLAQRGRRLVEPHEHLKPYWEFTKDMGLALAVMHRSKETQELYKEIRALTRDPAIHLRIAYALAMHYTRFAPASERDHITAKGWLQLALALVPLLPAGEQRAVGYAFHLNALALVEMHLGRKQEALRLVQEALDHLNAEIPEDQHRLYRTVLLANRGQLYAYMERWDQALEDYAEVIRLDPYYDDTYLKRAQLYYQWGRYEEALEDMTAGIEHGFPSDELLAGRANLLRLMGREEEALADYTAALAITPNFTHALLQRADMYRQRGHYEAALQDYTTGLTDSGPSFELFYNRAHLLDMLGREEEALADYARALAIAPTAIEVRLNRAMIFYEQEAYNAAREEVQQGLHVEPDHPRLLCTRGLIESALHENEQAYQSFTQALTADPSLVEAWTNRAIVAYEMGELDAAIADLTQALTIEEDAAVLSNRAHVYQAQQRWDEAIADYTRSLDLAGHNAEDQQELLYQRAQCHLHAGHREMASADIKALQGPGASSYLEAIHKEFAYDW